MHIINHLFRIAERRVLKVHRIPQIVVSPVLPILNDSIERNTQFTVFPYHSHRFFLALIPFLALEIAVSPKGKHGNLSGQCTHLRNHAISISTIHKVIVDAISHFRLERGPFRFISKIGWRIVIPEKTISFHRLHEWNHILHIALHKTFSLIALRHFPILKNAQSIKRFIFVQKKRLLNCECFISCIIKISKLRLSFLTKQRFSFSIEESHNARLQIKSNLHLTTFQSNCITFPGNGRFHFLRSLYYREALFHILPAIRRFQNSYN